MGSYLLILEKDGYRDTRVPFVVGRLENVSLDVKLHTDEEIGKDLVYVPAGKFLMGDGATMREVHVPDFFIGKLPVAFGEYCEYLDWLEVHQPDDVKKRAPQDLQNGMLVRRDGDGRYAPFAPGELPGRIGILDARAPVFSVSWYDAVAYLAWRSERDGRTYALPTEAEREKAARGVDGRTYPWGNRFDATLCKMLESTETASRPEPVGAYPTDESPYGVRDVAGGVYDWCDDWYDDRKEWKTVKGGSWGQSWSYCRSANRAWGFPGRSLTSIGIRLVVRPAADERPFG